MTCVMKNGKINRWALVQLITKCRTDLQINSRDITALSALMGCLPGNEFAPGKLPVVFPSNSYLSDRAGGMNERTLRRALASLVDAGLIERRNSSTGKRFPLKDRSGSIVDAFGFDLSPAFARLHELQDIAAEQEAAAQEAKSLRARIFALRADLMEAGHICADRLDILRRQLRRVLSLDVLRAILDDLTALCPTPASTGKTVETTAVDGQTDRHIKNPNMGINKPAPDRETLDCWQRCHSLQDFFPDTDVSPHSLRRIVFQTGQFLNLKNDQVAQAVAENGWGQVLMAFEYLVRNAERVASPAAYFLKMMRDPRCLARI